MIRVGTCAWADHDLFYPSGVKPTEKLAYYSRFFNVVEVDSSYYAIPPVRNFEKWVRETPAEFAFNVKAFRELTFHDRIDPKPETFAAFRASLAPAREAGKLRGVLFQFPPWFTANEKNEDYLRSIQEKLPDDLIAVEFRHTSWLTGDQTERTLTLLRDEGLAYSMVDAPRIGSGTCPKVVAVTHPALAIVRFHGRNTATWYKKVQKTGDRFNYLYSEDELLQWKADVDAITDTVRELHLVMNNNMSNYAVQNARDLQRLFRLPVADIAPQPAQLPLDA